MPCCSVGVQTDQVGAVVPQGGFAACRMCNMDIALDRLLLVSIMQCLLVSSTHCIAAYS